MSTGFWQVGQERGKPAIITNAHKINQGDFPDLKGHRDNDFFFIEEDVPTKVVQRIKELCTRRLPVFYSVDSINDIQVLLRDAAEKSSLYLCHLG